MKVLIQIRPDAFEAVGGDTIQMLKTAEYLRKSGVSVDTSTCLRPDLSAYDAVHLLNITLVKSTFVQLVNAKKQGKKVVLSPIYWSTGRAYTPYLHGLLRNIDISPGIIGETISRCSARYSKGRKPAFNEIAEVLNNKSLAASVLSKVDLLLPNSLTEFEVLKKDFQTVFSNNPIKGHIVPNGVDADVFATSSPKDFTEKYGVSDFVLCVGRFGFRKNQLSLINALKNVSLQTVFIGGAPEFSSFYWFKNSLDRAYYKKCRQYADSSFLFIPQVPHESLASAYAACKVLAVPSFYETPGLVALEAAVAGANICITKVGSTREYFSDYATYCDPGSVESIRKAVLDAYKKTKTSQLKNRVLENFTWAHAAKATLEAYEEVSRR
jgi:glycosyltransferase involved in cell wall biosynthesis